MLLYLYLIVIRPPSSLYMLLIILISREFVFFFVETSLNIICFMGPKIFYVKIGHHTELSNQSDGIIKKNQ